LNPLLSLDWSLSFARPSLGGRHAPRARVRECAAEAMRVRLQAEQPRARFPSRHARYGRDVLAALTARLSDD